MIKLKLSIRSIRDLMDDARRGYEKPYKSEVGGHLLGYRKGNVYHIMKTVPYNTPHRSRTEWSPNFYYFEKKGLGLETARLRWLGTYHSHPEVGRSASTLQSPEDIVAQLFSPRPLEIIIRVSVYPRNWPESCLSFQEGGTNYYYDICGYKQDRIGRISRIKVERQKKRSIGKSH